jgi:hypothetical protein
LETQQPKDAESGIVLGTIGHGKTEYVRGNPKFNLPGFIQPALKNGLKVLIIDTLDHPKYRDIPVLPKEKLHLWKSGVYRLIYEPDDMPEIYQLINTLPNLWNTRIIWEDAYKHIELVLNKRLRRLIIDAKNKNISMIFIYHAWDWIPKGMYKIMKYLEVFKTGDSPYNRKKDMPGYFDQAEKVYLEVLKSKDPYFHKLIVTGN